MSEYEALLRRAVALSDAGVHDQALAIAGELASLDPDNPEILLLLGHELYQLGLPQEALRPLQQVVGMSSANSFAWVLLSRVLAQTNQNDKALEAARRAVQLDPANALNLTTYALVAVHVVASSHLWPARRKKLCQDALGHAQRAVQLAPDDVEALFSLAHCLVALRRRREADSVCQQILQLDPTNLEAAHLSALMHDWTTLGGGAEHAQVAVRMLRLDPNDVFAELSLTSHLLNGWNRWLIAALGLFVVLPLAWDELRNRIDATWELRLATLGMVLMESVIGWLILRWRLRRIGLNSPTYLMRNRWMRPLAISLILWVLLLAVTACLSLDQRGSVMWPLGIISLVACNILWHCVVSLYNRWVTKLGSRHGLTIIRRR